MRLTAILILFGVLKSGSPLLKSITSTPSDFSFLTSAATIIVGEASICFTRSEINEIHPNILINII